MSIDFTEEAYQDDADSNHPHLDKDAILLFQVSSNFMGVLTFYIMSLFKQRVQEIIRDERYADEHEAEEESVRLYGMFVNKWSEHSNTILSGLGSIFQRVQSAARSNDGICCVNLKDQFLEDVYETLATQLEAASPHFMSSDVKCKLLLTLDLVKMRYSAEFMRCLPKGQSDAIHKVSGYADKIYTVYLDVQLTGTGMNSTRDFSTDDQFSDALYVNQNILDNLLASDSSLKYNGDDESYAPAIVH